MDSLSSLTAFVRAAETRSFVAAGRLLGVSASAIGKSVARLEEKLGVRLLQRSTRRISLTAEGALFLERGQRILADLADAESELARTLERPRGRLRLSLPVIGHHLLLPHLPDFMARYPEVELDIDFNDRLIDVIEEGVDVVIRSGTLNDSRLLARPLMPFRFCVAGSPAYFAQHGTPQTPADLHQHRCLHYKFFESGKVQVWDFAADALPSGTALPNSLVCNHIEALRSAAERGLGLAYLPDFFVQDHIAGGLLQTVLDPYLQKWGMFWLVWPSSRQLSPKLRVFIDFLCERMAAPTT